MKISLKELLVFPTLCESGFPISIVCCQKCLITFIFDLLPMCPFSLFAPALWIHVVQSNLVSICSVNQNHLKAVCNDTGVYFFSKLSSVNRQVQQKDVSVNYRLRLFLLCCFLSSLVFEEDPHYISQYPEKSIRSIIDKYASYVYGQEGMRNLLFHLTYEHI